MQCQLLTAICTSLIKLQLLLRLLLRCSKANLPSCECAKLAGPHLVGLSAYSSSLCADQVMPLYMAMGISSAMTTTSRSVLLVHLNSLSMSSRLDSHCSMCLLLCTAVSWPLRVWLPSDVACALLLPSLCSTDADALRRAPDMLNTDKI